METIQSNDNSVIKEAKKLKEKKYRTQNNEFLIEGFRFVQEALKSSFEVTTLFISDSALNKLEEFNIESVLQKGTKTYSVKNEILKGLCSTENPQGIVAVVKNREVEIKNNKGFYVLVDKIQDPGNMGTIIRTADAAGALGIIFTKGTVDIYNEKTLRSTMGSIFHIPVIYDENLSKINTLRENGFKVLVSSLEAEHNFFDVNLHEKAIIAVGNEGNGVSDNIYDIADLKAKIPMLGSAESLNVSVAASIMMYEYVRQNS